MKTCTVLILMGILINGAASMTHTFMGFETGSSQVPDFPEFVYVELVNGLQAMRYDSETKRAVPTQDWANRLTEDDPQIWEKETQINLNNEQWHKVSIENVKQRFNQTEGAHLVQKMYGCEWDDETDEITGYMQYAFDGEDFISLDWKTETWVAAKQQAFITKQKWEREGEAVRYKNDIHRICADWLKKYVRYGASTLKRKELPLVSLLQKSSSSPVTCHATGFYPDRAVLFWTKDGEEVSENVDPGEILPNGDGTFQTSVDLDLSSVPSADWDRYNCVFKFSGVTEDLITKLDRDKIRTNAKKNQTTIIITALVVLGVVIIAAAAVALFLIRKKKAQRDPQAQQKLKPLVQASNNSSASSQDDQVKQKLNPIPPDTELPE